MKVKSESEVAQSCPTPSDPMDGGAVHGICQATYKLNFGSKGCRQLAVWTHDPDALQRRLGEGFWCSRFQNFFAVTLSLDSHSRHYN